MVTQCWKCGATTSTEMVCCIACGAPRKQLIARGPSRLRNPRVWIAVAMFIGLFLATFCPYEPIAQAGAYLCCVAFAMAAATMFGERILYVLGLIR